jgi:tRNA 2-thiouridine synthesizing protein D
MKNLILTTIFFGLLFVTGIAQNKTDDSSKSVKIAVVISSIDAETVWNAFRLANYAAGEKDSVFVFLLGKGVEVQKIKDKDFDVQDMIDKFTENGGKILACGTCLRSRGMDGTKQCPVSSLSELYQLIKTSDKILTF